SGPTASGGAAERRPSPPPRDTALDPPAGKPDLAPRLLVPRLFARRSHRDDPPRKRLRQPQRKGRLPLAPVHDARLDRRLAERPQPQVKRLLRHQFHQRRGRPLGRLAGAHDHRRRRRGLGECGRRRP
ncbi:MAG: hypothetical protein ACK55I_50315, partial [bacterium]